MAEPNEYKQLRECYRMRIMLTDFLRARIQEVENEYGELEKCVCIPIDDNGIYVTKGNSAIVDIEMIKTNIKADLGGRMGLGKYRIRHYWTYISRMALVFHS